MSTFFLILISFWSVSFADLINCNGTLTCYQQVKTCAAGEDCQIDCYQDSTQDNQESCYSLDVNCPVGYKCTINCMGPTKQNCKEITLNAKQSSSLFMNAIGGENIMQSGKIYCPEGGDCNILCGADSESAKNGCLAVRIEALNSTNLTVNVGASQNIISYSNIYCPYVGPCKIAVGNTSDPNSQ